MTTKTMTLTPAPEGTEFRQILVHVGEDRTDGFNLSPLLNTFEITARADAVVDWKCTDIGADGVVLNTSGMLPHVFGTGEEPSPPVLVDTIPDAAPVVEDLHPVFERVVLPATDIQLLSEEEVTAALEGTPAAPESPVEVPAPGIVTTYLFDTPAAPESPVDAPDTESDVPAVLPTPDSLAELDNESI